MAVILVLSIACQAASKNQPMRCVPTSSSKNIVLRTRIEEKFIAQYGHQSTDFEISVLMDCGDQWLGTITGLPPALPKIIKWDVVVKKKSKEIEIIPGE